MRLCVAVAIAIVMPACADSTDVAPECRSDGTLLILAAQAVPSATLLPCLEQPIAGWSYSGSETRNGLFRFWLDSDRAGLRSTQVSLVAACDTAGTIEVLPGAGEDGTRRFEQPLRLEPSFAANRLYTFPGGCVEVTYRFDADAAPALVLEVDEAIGFRPRAELVAETDELGLTLCGAGAPPCAGDD